MGYVIHEGDCIEVMRGMADNSVDSIVTDPPYELGFMGKKWDSTGIANNSLMWSEALRVLKPGGHLLAFSGSRTYHRMTCAIEDAGFDIRDQIMWIYGCYSEDTECLTDSGWKIYTDISPTDKILQWEHTSNALSWYTPKEILVYPAPSNMINIVNRHTDQLLTENHSVYVKIKTHSRNEAATTYTKIPAGEIKNHWHKDFPVAGELISGNVVENPYLIGWWLTDAWLHSDGKACMFSQSKYRTLDLLRDALRLSDCKFSEYIKAGKKDTHKDEHTFYVTGNLSNYLISNFPERKLLMEVMQWDWDSRNLLLNGLIDGDGSSPIGSHAEVFWSLNRERLDVFQALCLSLNIRSHIDYDKGCVYLNRKTNTTQLQNKHIIKNVDYVGKNVWCLKTETGAFVVRRNGRAFISGNSGFPKSLDVSKAIAKLSPIENRLEEFADILKTKRIGLGMSLSDVDKIITGGSTMYSFLEGRKLDGVRTIYKPNRMFYLKIVELFGITGYDDIIENTLEVIGEKIGSYGYQKDSERWAEKSDITAPATDEAKQWNGWGTALKPAHEPICVARKPLTGTVASNVLEWGTGGLNIDACRVETGDKLGGGNTSATVDRTGKNEGWKRPWMENEDSAKESAERSLASVAKSEALGRWPANLIHDGSEEVVALFPQTGKSSGGGGNKAPGKNGIYGKFNGHEYDDVIGFGDSGSAARFFYCPKTSKSDRNEGIEKTETSGNIHPTVKPTELMRYLCRLVTPPNGTVLDMFNGSGSTGKAAILEGFEYIGIEFTPEYVTISEARLKSALEVFNNKPTNIFEEL